MVLSSIYLLYQEFLNLFTLLTGSVVLGRHTVWSPDQGWEHWLMWWNQFKTSGSVDKNLITESKPGCFSLWHTCFSVDVLPVVGYIQVNRKLNRLLSGCIPLSDKKKSLASHSWVSPVGLFHSRITLTMFSVLQVFTAADSHFKVSKLFSQNSSITGLIENSSSLHQCFLTQT